MNYDLNVEGSMNFFLLDCDLDVILALKKYIKICAVIPELDLHYYSDTTEDDF